MNGDMYTPWGKAETQWQLDEGIFLVETPEHGGLLVDCAKAETVLSAKARQIGKRWNNFLAFEQDADMLVVFYEHPDLYPWMEEELAEQFAEEGLRREHPDYFVAESARQEHEDYFAA